MIMKCACWLAGFSGVLIFAQNVGATAVHDPFPPTRPTLSISEDKAQRLELTVPTSSENHVVHVAGPALGRVKPLLSPIVDTQEGVEGVTLVTRIGFMPETLNIKNPQQPATKPAPISITKKGGKNAVPDGGATASLLATGLFGIWLVKRNLLKLGARGAKVE